MDNVLKVDKIGTNLREPIEISELATYYKTRMELEGREVVVYLRGGTDSKGDRQYTTLQVLGWLDENDPRVNDIYTQTSEEYNFKLADTEQEEIDLSKVVISESPREFMSFKTEMARGIHILANELIERKKDSIIDSRKQQFLQRRADDVKKNPTLEINNILSQLESEEEKNKARFLHDEMVECVLRGKYPYHSYVFFMKNLINIVQFKGYVVSKSYMDSWNEGRRKPSETYKKPSNNFLIEHCAYTNKTNLPQKDIMDINYGFDRLEAFEPTVAKSLGTSQQAVDNNGITYRINQVEYRPISAGGGLIYVMSENSEMNILTMDEAEAFIAVTNERASTQDGEPTLE